jgi:pilus assembly protein CpaB
MRAVSIRVNDVVAVAGFVMPGTRVDVIVSVNNAGEGKAEPMARTVVSNLLVLTAGTRYDKQDPNNANPQPVAVVTLAVLPEDAERIALATTQGTLSLALRNPTDVEPTKTPGVRLATLMRGPGAQPIVEQRENRPVAVRPKIVQVVAPPVAPAVYRVETIRAAKRADEIVH